MVYSNRNQDLGSDLRVQKFLNQLKSQKKIADWQTRQAEDAPCYPSFNELSKYQKNTEFTGLQAC